MESSMVSGGSRHALRVVHAESERAPAAAPAFASAHIALRDSVEFAGAVEPPDVLALLRHNAQRTQVQEGMPPSLATMLDWVKAYLDQARERAQQQDAEFFARMDRLTQSLDGIKGVEKLKVASDLVGATAPEEKDAFAAAAEHMAEQVLGAKAAASQSGGVPLELDVPELRIALTAKTGAATELRFEGVRVTVGVPGRAPLAEMKVPQRSAESPQAKPSAGVPPVAQGMVVAL